MHIHEWLHAARLYLQISAELYGASSHAFVDRCFWRIWRQAADAELFGQFVSRLEQKQLSRLGLVREMSLAPQHAEAVVHQRPYTWVEALHLARCLMVRHVPAASHIVDLGGAAPASLQGALLVMGYRHRFKTLTIVDLPPAGRLGHYARGGDERASQWIHTEMGQVRYLHGSMTDLDSLEDGKAGLVFCGQSIEHVSREAARLVLQHIHRVLQAGGILFMDTPNAALTRLQSPLALIHPEHQVEYRVSELADVVRAAGFKIQHIGGVCPMPHSARSGVFHEREIIQNARLSSRPQESYVFYIQASKTHTVKNEAQP